MFTRSKQKKVENCIEMFKLKLKILVFMFNYIITARNPQFLLPAYILITFSNVLHTFFADSVEISVTRHSCCNHLLHFTSLTSFALQVLLS